VLDFGLIIAFSGISSNPRADAVMDEDDDLGRQVVATDCLHSMREKPIACVQPIYISWNAFRLLFNACPYILTLNSKCTLNRVTLQERCCMATSKKDASLASKQLRNPKSTKAQKSVAGSDLAQARRSESKSKSTRKVR
jgi:hypothetical protein